MKKVILVLALVVSLVSVYGGSAPEKSQRLEEQYAALRDRLVNDTDPDVVKYSDDFESSFGYLRKKDPKNYNRLRQDFNDIIFSISRDQIKKFNEKYPTKIPNEDDLKKYGAIHFEQLKPETRDKLISFITGGRVMFKYEWDTLVASYYMSSRAAYGKAVSVNMRKLPTKEDVEIALDWVMSQEALWYIGYVSRFTTQYEYDIKKLEFSDMIMKILTSSETLGLWK